MPHPDYSPLRSALITVLEVLLAEPDAAEYQATRLMICDPVDGVLAVDRKAARHNLERMKAAERVDLAGTDHAT